ncbi:Alpha/Beta hydrolase protein [Catenaria anguillulae PL171]|uniref:Alpha/Beta hydrolase protein n=1 Tax=Catenaria anguillulae PL171 TaxID=765915 RepID=A0A1Y2HNU4_9FUNG|nr:Alpha/Beta hydrolase protein [Catenaria anguillulae PL171]
MKPFSYLHTGLLLLHLATPFLSNFLPDPALTRPARVHHEIGVPPPSFLAAGATSGSWQFSNDTQSFPPPKLLNTIEKHRIQLFAGLANVPYCASRREIESWSCGKCKSLSNIQVHSVIESGGTLGYIATRHDANQLLVDMTQHLRPWRYSKPSNPTTSMAILAGFMDAYDHVRHQLHDQIRRYYVPSIHTSGIVFSGHSLGGSLATIASVDLVLSHVLSANQIELVTFHTPVIGNHVFASLVQALHFKSIDRVTVKNDMILYGPLHRWQFADIPGEKYVDGNEIIDCVGTQDPRCSGNKSSMLGAMTEFPTAHLSLFGKMVFGPLPWGGCLW